jgi:phosphopantetheine--protein transferase-like protein
LPPVGNDIVDLAAPGNLGKSGDGRFCGRVFTAEERALIAGAPRPDALLWALWAAKEAAYKAVSRRHPAVCSIPRQYHVEINRDSALFIFHGAINQELSLFNTQASGPVPDSRFRGSDSSGMDDCKGNILTGKVITPRGELVLRVERTADWVHALAAESEEVVERIFLLVESPGGGDDPSAFVRRGLLREIACLLDCAVGDLSVIKNPAGSGAPGVLFRGYPLMKSVSLSHDGRFTAFAFDPLALIFSGALC